MNINKKTRGAVSVFLVMILVPCIVVTSLFVDLGRVHLSKSVATSASDLALNSLLTNYDADLKDWYGMVASCQNIDEFYEVSAQFFLRTASSQGLSDEEIILLADYYANATNDDTIYDLLRVECKTAPSDMITAVDGANLANATIIKDQIVEFMKYRAPIQITEDLIDRLNKDSSLTESNQAKVNEPLVDNKTAFYNAEGELLEAALNTYVAIYDYFSSARAYGLTNEKLNEYVNDINSYKEVYEKIHTLMVKDLYNTSGLGIYNRPVKNIGNYTSSKEAIGYKVEDEETGEVVYYINYTTIQQLVTDLKNKASSFMQKVYDFESAAAPYVNNMPGSSDNDAYDIQWWVRMSSVASANDIGSSAEAMLNAYAKVKAISECTLDETVPADWENVSGAVTIKSTVEGYCSKYLNSGNTTGSETYIKAVTKLEAISKNKIDNINPSTVTISIDGTNKTIGTALTDIQTELDNMKTVLETHVDYLDIAIDGKGDVKSLDNLLVLAETYETKLSVWETSANTTFYNGKSTTMADENKEEIAEIKNPGSTSETVAATGQEISEAVSPEKVTELKTRLTNIRSQFKNIISAIDDLKYGSQKLIDITTFDKFKSASKSQVSSSDIGLTNKELNDYAQTTFDGLYKPTTNPTYTLNNLDNSQYNPEINPDTKSVQTPEMFIYLHDKFKGLSKDDVDKKKKELDDGKGVGDQEAKNIKDKGRYHGGGTDIARDFSGTEQFSLADGAFSGMLDLINCLINLDISSIRHDLYVTTYTMEMFSYATYENEGLYGLVEKPTELTLKNYSTEYEKVKGDAKQEDNKGKWLSTELTDSYNKSLTNKLINKSNNAAYGAEVEYILYGGTNEDNVKAAYQTIYGIRYALNLVSGFANFWSAKNDSSNTTAIAINAIGMAIQTATGGIVPIALTKVVLIPILTIFETGKDLDRLEAGFPVEIYKKKYDEWWVSVPSKMDSVGDFTSALAGAIDDKNKDIGLFYSDYLTVFVYLGLKSNNSGVSETMYERIAEVIQSNMRMQNGIKDYTQEVDGGGTQSYTLKNSKVYFKLEATMRTEPLMLAMPVFNEYDNNLDTQTDWCTYKISTVRGYS